MKNSTKKFSKDKPLKIAIVFDDSLDRSDGVQQYIRTLGGWLKKQGHTVHYLVGQSTSDGETIHSLSKNVGVHFNKNRLTIPLPANKPAIKKLLETENYDVIHVQMPFSPFMAGRVIAAANKNTAIVATFHILPFGKFQSFGSKALAMVQKRALKRIDATCSVSPAAQAFAKSHFGIKTQVIPNMIDTAWWKTPLSPHKGRIVYIGRLVPRKGCKALLEAFNALPSALKNRTELLVAGDGPERAALEKFAITNQLHAHFLGFIDEEAKPSLLATADIAVFPSLGGESFGIVLIEAMASGAGVVLGGNNPGYASVLTKDALVNPKQTKAFATRLEYFLAEEKAKTTLHKSQAEAVKQYDVHVVGNKVLAMYKSAQLHRLKNVP